MKKYLYLPMEVKCREYPSKGILAFKAVKKGFEVFLGDSTVVQPLAFNGPPGVYLGTSVMEGHRRIYELLRNAGHNLVCLDEEGLVYYNKDNFVRGKVNEGVINMLDAYCLWGEHHRELVESKYMFKNLYSVGNPRIEILKKKYRSLYEKEAEGYLERYNDYILINTNFASANHYLGTDHCLSIVETLIDFKDEDRAYQYAKVAHARNNMHKFMRFVSTFANRYPEVNVIVRPHPSERVDTWKKLRRSNIHVLQEGSAIPWIMSAKCIVQQNCTTAIEAVVMGTPAISYIPSYDKLFDDSLLNEIVVKYSDVEDLIRVASSLAHSVSSDDLRAKFANDSIKRLKYYIDNLGEKSCAFEELINVLESKSVQTNAVYGLENKLRMLQRIEKRKNNGYEGYFAQKFDTLRLSDVNALVNQLGAIENENYANIKIEEVFANKLYRLYS